MSPTKINRLLNEALEKYGNIDIIQLIDYYWEDTYEGANNWKVRKKLTLQDIIDVNPDSTFQIDINTWEPYVTIRDILKYLESEEKAINYLPIKVSVFYEDSKQRAEELRKAHPKEEADKKAFLEHAFSLFNPYSESYRAIKKIYDI